MGAVLLPRHPVHCLPVLLTNGLAEGDAGGGGAQGASHGCCGVESVWWGSQGMCCCRWQANLLVLWGAGGKVEMVLRNASGPALSPRCAALWCGRCRSAVPPHHAAAQEIFQSAATARLGAVIRAYLLVVSCDCLVH